MSDASEQGTDERNPANDPLEESPEPEPEPGPEEERIDVEDLP